MLLLEVADIEPVFRSKSCQGRAPVLWGEVAGEHRADPEFPAADDIYQAGCHEIGHRPADDPAPLSALRAVAALERTRQTARTAAYNARDDELTAEAIGTGLGLSPHKADSRLTHYALRH
ncbi:hypothetical protein [Streptomyces sp. NBC_01264]|uniref:hypothetical protein n=1 Tax=Streptomyces sp. NBC_01264 TaxID=2903804 RepID=UPI0022586DCE|nr:hypothetical protein [Streptomyces sp. NBC_01264]MCX4781511.1 hypothetical protein [Streptomyces sp. NBC_01264]